MHAVAAQEKTVVQRHRLAGVIEPQLRLDAQRAGQDMRAAGSALLPHVIGGQAGQAVAAEAIGARIPDMQQVDDAAAQHQRGEGASHPRQFRVLPAQGLDPFIERVDDRSRGAAHFHGFWQVPKSVDEAAHRGLGRHAAALRAADSVGDGRHHLPARLGKLGAENGGDEILVALARPGFRDESDAGLDAVAALSHRHRSAGA